LTTRIISGEQYRSQSSSLCSVFYSPVASFLLGPYILLSTLFSNTLCLRSSLSMRDQVSHPYNPRGKNTSTVIQTKIVSQIKPRPLPQGHCKLRQASSDNMLPRQYCMNVGLFPLLSE
jgi:hypothetical protein